MPFCTFELWVPLLKPKSRKKGTLIIQGLLRNLVKAIFRVQGLWVDLASVGFNLALFRARKPLKP